MDEETGTETGAPQSQVLDNQAVPIPAEWDEKELERQKRIASMWPWLAHPSLRKKPKLRDPNSRYTKRGKVKKRVLMAEREEKVRRLTDKQMALIQGIAEGKSKAQAAKDAGYAAPYYSIRASQELAKPNVKASLEQLLEEVGLTREFCLEPVKDAMGAEKLIYQGRGKPLLPHPDHEIRLKAAGMGLKMHGLLQGENEGSGGVVINVVNYDKPPEPEIIDAEVKDGE